MGRLRALRPGTHLRERVRHCFERTSAASRGGRRRLDPSGTGRAGAGTSSDALASAAPVSDQALGLGLGGGASAPLSWSHPSPDGYYQRTHSRCPTTDPKTSVIGTCGRQRRRPRSLLVDVGSPRHWFRSAPYTVRNCDRGNTCPRTGTEAIATAAAKTSTFGCRRKRPQLRGPGPASSDKGQGNRARGCENQYLRMQAEAIAPVETKASVFGQRPRKPRLRPWNPAPSGKGQSTATRDRRARRLRTKSNKIATCGHGNQRLRTMVETVVSWK